MSDIIGVYSDSVFYRCWPSSRVRCKRLMIAFILHGPAINPPVRASNSASVISSSTLAKPWRVEKNVKSRDLFIADDDHVHSRIGRRRTAGTGSPC